MMVVVSSNTTPGKVIDKPAPVLLRTESAANSKVLGHSLVVTQEIYAEDECMRKAIRTIEDVLLETNSPTSTPLDCVNGNAIVFELLIMHCCYTSNVLCFYQRAYEEAQCCKEIVWKGEEMQS